MNLELLHKAAIGAKKPVKLLFVHGICTGAWVWERHFLPYFAGLGYENYALSLRGHGRSEGRERIRQHTLADFAADVAWAMDRIGGRVVLLGHSLGGGVVQNYVQRGGKAAGIVLLCSAPPHGLLRASVVMLAKDPALAREMSKVLHEGIRGANLGLIEEGLFSEPPPPEVHRDFGSHISDIAEAASRELSGWIPFAPLPWSMPRTLAIGCENDRFIPAADVRLTAIYYGARCVIVPNGAHAIMLDRNWKDAAEPIAGWLSKTIN